MAAFQRSLTDGKELFYLSPDGTLMAAAVQAGSHFNASAPTTLFKTRVAEFVGSRTWTTGYVPAEGGQRFLINTVIEETALSPVTVVLNWPAALSRR